MEQTKTRNGNFKRVLCSLMVAALVFALIPTTIHAQPTTAQPSAHTVILDGETITPIAFLIGGNNFFMLRDIAYVLNGTDAQFEITWDGELNAINLLTGQAYTPVGGEMAQGTTQQTTAIPSTAAVYVDGTRVNLRAYNIVGNNFFMLRDLGDALGFGVDWDADAGAVVVSSVPVEVVVTAQPTQPAGDIPAYITIGGQRISTAETEANFIHYGLTSEDIILLRYMVNLIDLELAHNQITDLTPLAGLTSLTRLGLWDNQITDITPLAGLTNLTRLDLGSNSITDLTPLAGLVNLTQLSLYFNPITDLTPVEHVETIWGQP